MLVDGSLGGTASRRRTEHRDGGAGVKGEACRRGDARAREEVEAMALGHGGDDVLDLGGGEGAGDTAARAAAGGAAGEQRAGRARLGPEAGGVEEVRVLPRGRMAGGDGWGQHE